MKKIYLFLFLLIVFSSFTYAAPPLTEILFNQNIIFSGDTGINVEVNLMQTYKYGEARWSVIHLFNATSGYQLNITTHPEIECHIHLRNSQGFEIHQVKATTHNDHWDLNGSEGGSTPIGNYAWTLTCNDPISQTGGYKSGFFSVTEGGYPDDKSVFLTLIVAVIGFCFLLLYIAFNLEKVHVFFKLIILFSVIFIQIYLGSVVINLVSGTIYESVGFVFYNAILWFIRLFVIYIFVYLIYSIFNYFEKIPKIKGWKK